MKLVIVESPGKISKLSAILGKDYRVMASVGHVVDLDPECMSVDIEGPDPEYRFKPIYKVKKDRRQVLARLKEAAAKATTVLLASDADREGEAISKGLCEALKLKTPTQRITFNSITASAVLRAVQNPRDIDEDLVSAQKARRVMDRLVGYSISPLLGSHKSAGRVQSVALKMIIDRESAVNAAAVTTHLKATADFDRGLEGAIMRSPATGTSPREVCNAIAANGAEYTVASTKIAAEERIPPPPFTTSTLQQEAWSKLHMTGKEAMLQAQRLYEEGLITYHRTDSTAMSEEGREALRNYVEQHYGLPYFQSREWTTGPLTQEAHECIRPTNFFTDNSEDRLYSLIRTRAIASQMKAALFDIQTVRLVRGDMEFQVVRRNTVFYGFLSCVKTESLSPPPRAFVRVDVGDTCTLLCCEVAEEVDAMHANFTEGTLIKHLESTGVGRPSTYAATVSLLKERGYVTVGDDPGKKVELRTVSTDLATGAAEERTRTVHARAQKKCLLPSATGKDIVSFLEQHFPAIMDVEFTGRMETRLDTVARGETPWQSVVSDLMKAFYPKVLELGKKDSCLGTDEAGCRYSIFNGKYGLAVRKEHPVGNGEYVSSFSNVASAPQTLQEAIEAAKGYRFLGLHRKKAIFVVTTPTTIYLRYGDKRVQVKASDGARVTFAAAKKLI